MVQLLNGCLALRYLKIQGAEDAEITLQSRRKLVSVIFGMLKSEEQSLKAIAV